MRSKILQGFFVIFTVCFGMLTGLALAYQDYSLDIDTFFRKSTCIAPITTPFEYNGYTLAVTRFERRERETIIYFWDSICCCEQSLIKKHETNNNLY